jgi:catechol 2,3-dioxygenase-like lactoylglutathione lyase family enzyme
MAEREKGKRRAAKSGAGGSAKKAATQNLARGPAGDLTFNHAMLYSADVGRALKFYAGALGFRVIEEFAHEGRMVYARLRSPGSDSTLGLHQLEPGHTVPQGEGVRLYFEIKSLEAFCKKLEESGTALDRPPKLQPWGWTHAYLRDPDGHELSLYWAGAQRLRKSRG